MNVLVEKAQEFVDQTRVLPASDPASGARVDFIFSSSNYERQAIDNAKDVKILDSTVSYARAEDVIIHKVIAGHDVDIADNRLHP